MNLEDKIVVEQTTISWFRPSDLYAWLTADYVNYSAMILFFNLSIVSYLTSTALWEYGKYYTLTNGI